MKHSMVVYMLLIGTLLCSACKKVINVKLQDAAPQLVIEANVTDDQQPATVQITQTVSFTETNTFPPVSGAMVKITDSTNGTSEVLSESNPGVYVTRSMKGVPGHTYLLDVSVNGNAYSSSSSMPQQVILDSLTVLKTNFFNNLSINAVANFQDPPGTHNYYQFVEYINHLQLDEAFVFDDRLSDGKYISNQLFADSSYVSVGDTLTLSMYCVDRNIYNYFNEVSLVSGNNGQPVTPTNPDSNITNGALGYFSAHTVQRKTIVVN